MSTRKRKPMSPRLNALVERTESPTSAYHIEYELCRAELRAAEAACREITRIAWEHGMHIRGVGCRVCNIARRLDALTKGDGR
jgi:hypothetical protein